MMRRARGCPLVIELNGWDGLEVMNLTEAFRFSSEESKIARILKFKRVGCSILAQHISIFRFSAPVLEELYLSLEGDPSQMHGFPLLTTPHLLRLTLSNSLLPLYVPQSLSHLIHLDISSVPAHPLTKLPLPTLLQLIESAPCLRIIRLADALDAVETPHPVPSSSIIHLPELRSLEIVDIMTTTLQLLLHLRLPVANSIDKSGSPRFQPPMHTLWLTGPFQDPHSRFTGYNVQLTSIPCAASEDPSVLQRRAIDNAYADNPSGAFIQLSIEGTVSDHMDSAEKHAFLLSRLRDCLPMEDVKRLIASPGFLGWTSPASLPTLTEIRLSSNFPQFIYCLRNFASQSPPLKVYQKLSSIVVVECSLDRAAHNITEIIHVLNTLTKMGMPLKKLTFSRCIIRAEDADKLEAGLEGVCVDCNSVCWEPY